MVASSASGNPACFTVRERRPVRTTSGASGHRRPRRDARIAGTDVLVGGRLCRPDNATPAGDCVHRARRNFRTCYRGNPVGDDDSPLPACLPAFCFSRLQEPGDERMHEVATHACRTPRHLRACAVFCSVLFCSVLSSTHPDEGMRDSVLFLLTHYQLTFSEDAR
jgi:hypothetical protein